MNQILLYGNGASENHGCEAIIRGTAALLEENTKLLVFSEDSEQDYRYGIGTIAEIQEAKGKLRRDSRFFFAYAKMKTVRDYATLDELCYDEKIRSVSGQVELALSAGGDNYCYKGTEIYALLNKAYHKAGIKTVLWGCSIEPSVVEKPGIRRDLRRYDGIVARESISYKAIQSIHPRVILAPDPAFFMREAAHSLDERFYSNEVIGINLSPMSISHEQKKGVTFENYRNLVNYILDKTEYNVALIPHVVWSQNDDRKVLGQLYDSIRQKERIIVVNDMSAPELKYCISRCKVFVGSRTHATIAAYSSGVPTLAVGYSVKAKGIAKDLFGRYDHFVIPVQSLTNSQELTKAFQWIEHRECRIREHLLNFLPEYVKRGKRAVEMINKM